jgi:hypothetical protein
MTTPTSADSTPNRRNEHPARRWIMRVVAGLVALPLLLWGVSYAWQNWFAASADPNLVHELKISRGEKKAEQTASTEEGKAAATTATLLPGVLSGLSQEALDAAENPLDVVLDIADKSHKHLLENIRDYECLMVSAVQMNGKLRDAQYMQCKIREGNPTAGIPFAVYGKFLKPQSLNGQEVIWVEGKNDGNLVAHQAGLLNLTRWNLPPDGTIAMNGNKYPITEIGLVNLLELMIERGRRDRAYGECEISFDPKVEVDGRKCVLLEIRHPKKEGPYDFHLARIYFDIEQQLLFGYEGFDWPAGPGQEPPLLEKFFYSDLRLNVGLTEADFDPNNPAYNYPGKKRD